MTLDTWQDPVVTEVRKNRETIYEEYGGDMRKYEEHLQELDYDVKKYLNYLESKRAEWEAAGIRYETKEEREARFAWNRQQRETEDRRLAAI